MMLSLLLWPPALGSLPAEQPSQAPPALPGPFCSPCTPSRHEVLNKLIPSSSQTDPKLTPHSVQSIPDTALVLFSLQGPFHHPEPLKNHQLPHPSCDPPQENVNPPFDETDPPALDKCCSPLVQHCYKTSYFCTISSCYELQRQLFIKAI